MRRIICVLVILSFCISFVSSQDSEWERSFTILDAIELNLNELKNSNELQKGYNQDLMTAITDSLNLVKEQQNVSRQWTSLWSETEDVLKTQQNSLERYERRCKILGISIAIALPVGIAMGIGIAMAVNK